MWSASHKIFFVQPCVLKSHRHFKENIHFHTNVFCFHCTYTLMSTHRFLEHISIILSVDIYWLLKKCSVYIKRLAEAIFLTLNWWQRMLELAFMNRRQTWGLNESMNINSWYQIYYIVQLSPLLVFCYQDKKKEFITTGKLSAIFNWKISFSSMYIQSFTSECFYNMFQVLKPKHIKKDFLKLSCHSCCCSLPLGLVFFSLCYNSQAASATLPLALFLTRAANSKKKKIIINQFSLLFLIQD